MDILNIFGYIATVLTIFYLLPQVIKTWKSRSTGDISIGMYILGSFGALFWVLYGTMLHSVQLIFTNVVVLISSLIILGFKIRYK